MAAKLSNLEVNNQSLWVVPASEVRRRNINDPSTALRDLGATLAVKGSLEREGQDIHLTANLIDTKSLRQIGSTANTSLHGDFRIHHSTFPTIRQFRSRPIEMGL